MANRLESGLDSFIGRRQILLCQSGQNLQEFCILSTRKKKIKIHSERRITAKRPLAYAKQQGGRRCGTEEENLLEEGPRRSQELSPEGSLGPGRVRTFVNEQRQ